MNLDNINELLYNDRYAKKIYLGGYAKDDLPINVIKRKDNYALILNTDLKTGEGIHWLAVVFTNNNLHIYDPLAANPLHDSYILELVNYHKNTKAAVHYI